MKKLLLLSLPLAGICSMASAQGNFYLQSNIGIGQNWNQPERWFDQTSGGGSNPTQFEGHHFDAQNFVLRSEDMATSTFNGASLSFSSTFQPQSAEINIPNTLNLMESGSFRLHNTWPVLQVNVGVMNAMGTNTFRSVNSSGVPPQDVSFGVNVGTLTGAGIIRVNNLTEGAGNSGSHGSNTWTVGDASGFTGTIEVNARGGLTFTGAGNNFANATLSLPSPSDIAIILDSNVSVGALSGGGFADVAPGDYGAAALNSLVGSTVFSGGAQLTVVPEPSTYSLMIGLTVLSMAVLYRRRKR